MPNDPKHGTALWINNDVQAQLKRIGKFSETRSDVIIRAFDFLEKYEPIIDKVMACYWEHNPNQAASMTEVPHE